MEFRREEDGTRILLDGDELTQAVCDWIRAQGIRFGGPHAVQVTGDSDGYTGAIVRVDPSGWVRLAALSSGLDR